MEVSKIQTKVINKEKKMRTLSKVFKSLFVYRLPGLSLVLFLSLIILAGCSKKLELNSDWLNREITVDGKSDDWLGAMYYFEDENISIGLLNDENFMYICMVAEDQLIRNQVMRQGFTLWFNPDGSKKKTFGIKFPIGMQASGIPMRIGFPTRMEEGERDPEQFWERFRESLTELEILGPGKDESKRMSVEEAKGIDIDVRSSTGMLVYELKVPLHRSEDNPYAIGAKAGNSVGIGLETPKLDWKMLRKRMGSRMPGRGGMPGGPRMPGGGRGGMPGGGMRPQIPKGIKVWAIVQLASDNSPVSESVFRVSY